MAVACFALGVTACAADDEEPSADAPDGTGITAPPESVESMAGADSPDRQIEVATAFWEAIASADREVALSFVDPAFVESGAGDPFGRARTLERQFDWYEAVGWEWSLEGCTRGDAGAVECTAAASNAWSDALGVEPVTGTFVVSFGDDGILTVNERSASFSSQWLPTVFQVFQQWVSSNHPDDARVMFDFSVDLNPEILALYEVNTERFVDAQ